MHNPARIGHNQLKLAGTKLEFDITKLEFTTIRHNQLQSGITNKN